MDPPQPSPNGGNSGDCEEGYLPMLFVALVCAVVWALSDHLPLQSEVTVYQGFCPVARVNEQCPGKEEAAGVTTFKVLVNEQAVVYWSEGTAPQRPYRCAVRDTRNWSCTFDPPKDGEVNQPRWDMIDGDLHYVGTDAAPGSAIFYQIPKAKWWWLHATGR